MFEDQEFRFEPEELMFEDQELPRRLPKPEMGLFARENRVGRAGAAERPHGRRENRPDNEPVARSAGIAHGARSPRRTTRTPAQEPHATRPNAEAAERNAESAEWNAERIERGGRGAARGVRGANSAGRTDQKVQNTRSPPPPHPFPSRAPSPPANAPFPRVLLPSLRGGGRGRVFAAKVRVFTTNARKYPVMDLSSRPERAGLTRRTGFRTVKWCPKATAFRSSTSSQARAA